MNRDKMQAVFDKYESNAQGQKRVDGCPSFFFTRQSLEDVKAIEEMKTEDLCKEWKGLDYVNHIRGNVSINDLMRMELIELELESRDEQDAIADLYLWHEQADKDFNDEISLDS